MFNIDYIALFKGIPPNIATFLIAMLPIAELRGALPIALGVYKMSLFSAFFWSVLGNIIPVFFILWFLEPLSQLLIKQSKLAKSFFNWLFGRTRNRFKGKYQKYGELALIIFVAIPLPITGAWTGSIAAFLFGIPFKRALPLITIGVLIAGIIVTLIYQGTFSFLKFII